MIQTVKAFFQKHFAALSDERTAQNERQAIVGSVTDFLMGLFRFVIIVGVCYVILGPVLGILTNSFFSNKDAYNPMVYMIPQNPTLERYETAMKLLDYFPTMLRSLLYSLVLMLMQILTCSMAGYGFARFKFPLKSLLFGCVVVMIVIPSHTIMLPLYMTFRSFDPFGLITAITGKELNMMKTPYPMMLMTILGCGLRSGLYIYIFNQFFRGLPKEIEEAALVDGAGTWYTYFNIMLRNAMPSVITVAVFSLVWQYNDTFYAHLFQIPQSMSIGTRISTLVANVANQYKVMDRAIQTLYLDTGIILMLVPVVLIYVLLQKQFIEGVERSGIVG